MNPLSQKQDSIYLLGGSPRESDRALFISIKMVTTSDQQKVISKVNRFLDYTKTPMVVGDILTIEYNIKRKDKIGPRDTIVHTSYQEDLIYDGESFIDIIKIGNNVQIPRFFIVDEFSVHYWDSYNKFVFLNFDINKYLDQIMINLHDDSKLGNLIKYGGIKYNYWWSSFKSHIFTKSSYLENEVSDKLIPDLYDIVQEYSKEIDTLTDLPYTQSEAFQKLIPDLNNIVQDYFSETFYIIFFSRYDLDRKYMEETLLNSEFREQLLFMCNFEGKHIFGKEFDFQDNIIYVEL